jgi:glucuronate isomerase
VTLLVPDRLFPVDPQTRGIARELYQSVADKPIISPHGHTDPRWYAENQPFPDPAQLFITPDHYVFRMLFSQGISLESLGVPRADGGPTETDGRKIWRLFAENYHLFPRHAFAALARPRLPGCVRHDRAGFQGDRRRDL